MDATIPKPAPEVPFGPLRAAALRVGWPLLLVGLAPVLWLQGRAARRRTPRTPEPPGSLAGRRGPGDAHDPRGTLRVLFVGDSSVAAVGASEQRYGMPRRTVEALASERRVQWTVIAQTGATTRSTIERLEELDLNEYDAAVIGLGVNDVTSMRSLGTWRREQRSLRRLLRERAGVTHIISCGLPPVRAFPALPQPLRWVLGLRAEQFADVLARDAAEEVDTDFLPIDFSTDVGEMASDGFHPGEPVYASWGLELAQLLKAR